MDIVLVSFFVVFEQVSRKEMWKSFGTCWSVYRTLILHVITFELIIQSRRIGNVVNVAT